MMVRAGKQTGYGPSQSLLNWREFADGGVLALAPRAIDSLRIDPSETRTTQRYTGKRQRVKTRRAIKQHAQTRTSCRSLRKPGRMP